MNSKIYEAIIIGAGLAGLECGNTFIKNNMKDFLIIERRSSIIRQNSWKTFHRVIDDFNLHEFYRNKIDGIILRTIDIEKNEILSEKKEEFECYALNSAKIYEYYLNIMRDEILTNTEVISIEVINNNLSNGCKRAENQAMYKINCEKSMNNKEIGMNADEINNNSSKSVDLERESVFLTKRIIDASGCAFVTDHLLKRSGNKTNFPLISRAYYVCYAKRYKNCNDSILNNSVIFDFDDAFKFFGSWTYPLGGGEIEIGLAKLSNYNELYNEKAQKKIIELHAKYLKMKPFDKIFENAQPMETIKGIISLLPRTEICKSNIYFIGDTKGAVAYSGYGVENALKSGREAALSIIDEINAIKKNIFEFNEMKNNYTNKYNKKLRKRKKYNFHISSPSKSLAILTLLWNSPPNEIKTISKAVGDMNRQRLYQFYTGDINLGFFIDATRACIKNKINSLAMIKNPGLVFRALFNLKPKPRDFEVFKKKLDNN